VESDSASVCLDDDETLTVTSSGSTCASSLASFENHESTYQSRLDNFNICSSELENEDDLDYTLSKFIKEFECESELDQFNFEDDIFDNL